MGRSGGPPGVRAPHRQVRTGLAPVRGWTAPAGQRAWSRSPRGRSPPPQVPGTHAPSLHGESHSGEPPRALPPDRGPRPPTKRAPVHGPPSQGTARPEGAAHKSLDQGDGSLFLLVIFRHQSPSVNRESRGGPRGPPRCCFKAAPSTTRVVGPRSRGLDRAPLRAPRRDRRGTSSHGSREC
ncbi:hypothetical protein NDU88_002077 [Pleurodeles waltl]|uniref:Uncharacterized protein n=1 Tax=Pleurodeles waltl TaxID=8319 RepID=A0AAV7MMA5_PLEWA|nr:hypothetical protein NDU88_002077 [Pleurodeles waltl]